MMSTQRDDPYPRFNFLVSIGGEDAGSVLGGFAEVVGLGVDIEYVEYRNGNERRGRVRKLPGLHHVSDVVLKRGVIGSTALFEWITNVSQGASDRRNVIITLLDEQRSPVMTWRLLDAQPKKWTGPALNAKASGDVAMEELVLVAEGLELE
jgi:phage tail-like protein